jgi:hypothetical protein
VARKANLQKLLDSLIEQIGKHIARGVAEGVARSGLLKQLSAISRSAKQVPATSAGPKKKPGRPKKKAVTCSVRGCKETARAKGKCSKHYQRDRYKKKKGPTGAKKKKKTVKRKAKKIARKAKPKKTAKKVAKKASKKKSGTCEVAGCTRKVHARGMCGRHFMAWVRSRKK